MPFKKVVKKPISKFGDDVGYIIFAIDSLPLVQPSILEWLLVLEEHPRSGKPFIPLLCCVLEMQLL